MSYWTALPPPLANLHVVFHVSRLRIYIHVLSHVIQVDDIQVKENPIVKETPMQIEDREVNQLCGKEIVLVKIVWGGPAGGSVTWGLEIKMRESYPTLFF